MILDMLLSVDGYDVFMVEDGKAALDYLKDNTPDLAILDLKMPHAGGFEVCGRMKRVSRLKDVPVMILTAHRDENTLDEARFVHADAVVFKPLEGKNFRETVKNLLEKKPVQDDAA